MDARTRNKKQETRNKKQETKQSNKAKIKLVRSYHRNSSVWFEIKN